MSAGVSALKRITDLFIEGKEAFLGLDTTGQPVVVWVNKLNSFEREESVRDATVRRAERMSELGDDSSEVRGVKIEVDLWNDEELREALVSGQEDEVYMEALDELQTDPAFRELEDYVRRAPDLMNDDEVVEGDPRLQTLGEKSGDFTRRIAEKTAEIQKQRTADLGDVSREKLERMFIEQWRKRRTFEEFMNSRRITELFLGVRQCDGVRTVDLAGEERWDHAACDHSLRLFSERGAVRKVPEQAIVKIVDVMNELMMPPRDAGNSDAPASSSAPSEQSSAPEAPSTPSTPVETSPVVASI